MEIWKSVVGFEELFEVSSYGNFRRKGTEVLLKQHKHPNGYMQVNTMPTGRKGKAKTFRVHQEVCKAFLPNPYNKPQVNHKDGIKTNNRLENLEWVTAKENMRHAFDKGLIKVPVGDSNPLTRVSDAVVLEMYSKYERGEISLRKAALSLQLHHNTLKKRYNNLKNASEV